MTAASFVCSDVVALAVFGGRVIHPCPAVIAPVLAVFLTAAPMPLFLGGQSMLLRMDGSRRSEERPL